MQFFRSLFTHLPSRQEQPSKVHFDDLPYLVVYEIFSLMEPKELLATERVSKNWQWVVRDTLLRNVKTLTLRHDFGEHELVYHKYVCKHMMDITIKLDGFKLNLEEEEAERLNFVKKLCSRIGFYDGPPVQRGKKTFANCLSKLSGVRSIDFADQRINVQTLVQAFELCPMLECIKIGDQISLVSYQHQLYLDDDEDDWTEFFNRFGNRLVHISINVDNSDDLFLPLAKSFSIDHRLEMICFTFHYSDDDIVTAINQFQDQKKNVYTLYQFEMLGHVDVSIGDTIDTLVFRELEWNLLPDVCRRLSSLSFARLLPESDSPDQFKSVNFFGLRKLCVENVTDLVLQVLSRCQIANLKKMSLRFREIEIINNVDENLEQLFVKMPNLTEIRITDTSYDQHQVPGPALLRLKCLTHIHWRVEIQSDWNADVMLNAFDVIGQIQSLKKLKFEYSLDFDSPLVAEVVMNWRLVIDNLLGALKKQRPDLVVEDSFVEDF